MIKSPCKKIKCDQYFTSITDIPKDVIGYMMMKFLTPYDIKSCVRSNSHFHNALSDREKNLIKRASYISIGNAVITKDMEVFYYLFKLHDLKNRNPICFRIDIILYLSVDHQNMEALDFLLNNFKIKPEYVAKALEDNSRSLQCFKETAFFKVLDYCKKNFENIYDIEYVENMTNTKIKAIDSICYNFIADNAVSTLKTLCTKYNIVIPSHLIRNDVSNEMTAFLRTHAE